jgi:hypothetical protein
MPWRVVETAVQDTVDERDHQYDHDRRSDDHRGFLMQVPAPDEQAGKEFDRIVEYARHADARAADQYGGHQRAQVSQSGRAADAHLGRNLALPGGRGNQHRHAYDDGHDHDADLHRVQRLLRRWPPLSVM